MIKTKDFNDARPVYIRLYGHTDTIVRETKEIKNALIYLDVNRDGEVLGIKIIQEGL